jgi:hypothetical protein
MCGVKDFATDVEMKERRERREREQAEEDGLRMPTAEETP